MTIPDDVFEGIWVCQRVWQAGGRWHAMYRSTVDDTITLSHYLHVVPFPVEGNPYRFYLQIYSEANT